MEGVGPTPRGTPCDPWSMSLNVPHHKEKEYIWFMGGDLNGFHYAFYENGVGHAPEGPRVPCH